MNETAGTTLVSDTAPQPAPQPAAQPAASSLLSVRGLTVCAGEKEILHGIDLDLGRGETHVLMGPNGAGKSTLGRAVMGDASYRVAAGSVVFDGADVTALSADKRSVAGMFLSYQAPVEVPGVPLYQFLRAISRKRPELKMSGAKFRAHVGDLCDELSLNQSYLVRDLNVGFSGGERKKVEMLQLLLLQPKLAILDETDSGLDVDALEIVARGIKAYRERCDGTLLVITHNTRLLSRLAVDRTHVMVRGSLVASGPGTLVEKIDREGFGAYEARAAELEAQAAEQPAPAAAPEAGDRA